MVRTDNRIADGNFRSFFALKEKFWLVKHLIICVLVGATFQFSPAQKQHYFDHLTTADGLLANDVFSVFLDSKGYVWIGSIGGLQRFDGYDFLDFTYDLEAGMPESAVRHIMETSTGEIWAGIRGGGIVRIKDNQLLAPYLHEEGNTNSLAGNYVESIVEDQNGGFWIATDKGLDYLKDDQFTHFQHSSDDDSSLSNDVVHAIHIDDSQNLWVGTQHGLNLYLGDGRFKRFLHDEHNTASLPGNYIHGITSDGQGNVWLAVVLGGVNKLNTVDYTVERFRHNPAEETSLGNDIVLDVKYSKADSSLWIASWGGGLNKFKNGVFTRYQHSFGDQTTILSDNIEELFIDNKNNLWVASFGGGISKFSKKNIKGYLYKDFRDKGMFATSSLRAIIPASDSSIWMTTHLGINRVKKDHVESFSYDPTDSQFGLSSPRAQAIFEDSKGRIWVGYTRAGADMIADGVIARFPYDDSSDEGIGINEIISICEDTEGTIWFSSFTSGLSAFDGQRFTRYTTEDDLIDDRVLAVYPGKKSGIWIATTKGLSHFKDGKFRNYKSDNSPESLPKNRLRTVVVDGNDQVWVGYVGGVSRLDPETGKFRHYDRENGLGDNIVESLAVDGKGLVWVATHSGLAKYNPDYDVFINYSKEDGLLSEQVVYVSYDRWNDRMVIGTPAGFFLLNTSTESENQGGELQFTSFVLNSEKEEVLPIAGVNEITLPPYDNSFTISYSTLGGDIKPRDKYAYKMEPLNDDWIFAGDRSSLKYTFLNPGSYTLKVKQVSAVGEAQVSMLKILILPYWWQTWWFRVVLGVAFLILLFVLFRWRVRRTERQKEKLNVEVKKKTDQLRDAQARLIESEKMASVGLLTAGIAHEINNPLNFIQGSSVALERLLSENVGDQAEIYAPLLNGLKIGVERVDAIVKGLNRFNHQSTGKKEKCDIHLIIDNCLIMLQSNLKDKIIVNKKYFKGTYQLLGFEGELHQVFLNILVNASQAINESGKISIETKVSGDNLFVVIEDTGIGIDKEDLVKVTSPFYTTKPPGSGTGLGMSIGYRIIQDHQGSMQYDSEKGKGTKVTVTLPLNK